MYSLFGVASLVCRQFKLPKADPLCRPKWRLDRQKKPQISPLRLLAIAIATAAFASSPAKADDPEAFNRDGFFLSVSGPHQPTVKLFGIERGHKRRRPIVLLHGLGASSYSWRRVIPLLAKRHRVIAFDLRGHGRSDKPFDRDYAHAAQAELIRDAIEQLRLRNVTLVGHSYGGAVALVAALQANARRERRIRKLAILNAPAFPQKLSFAVRFLQKPLLPYIALTLVPPQVPVTMALMAEAFGVPGLTNADINIYAQPLFDSGARHALIETARQIQPPNTRDLIAHYPTIRQPTQIIWCRKDQVVPLTTGQKLHRALPRSRLTILEGCDHATPEQKPREVARLIRSIASR